MIIYLAQVASCEKYLQDYFAECGKFSLLESFYYSNKLDEFLLKNKKYIKNFLLDSGAFTFLTSKRKNIDWVNYVDQYADFINRHNIEKFFELDIDKIIGYEEVVNLRKRLEAKTKKQCIPVWHRYRGKENFLKMCEEYKYVAIGGIAIKEIKKEEYPIFNWLLTEAHKRKTKVHGLGFTSVNDLLKYRFDTVDSTSWLNGNKYGLINQFDGKTIIKHQRKPNQQRKGTPPITINNFIEWVKFQKYAELYL